MYTDSTHTNTGGRMFTHILNKMTHYFLHRAIEQLEAENELHNADTVIDFCDDYWTYFVSDRTE